MNVVYGKFKIKDMKCPLCKKQYKKYEEKQTDVNIAIQLLELAVKDEYDTAVIISGDSDLIPSIKAVRSLFPTKSIWLIIPINRSAKELINYSDKHMRIKEKQLKSSIFPKEIKVSNNFKLICPEKWQ